VDPGAPRLAANIQQLAEIGHGVTAGRHRLPGGLLLTHPPPDPRFELPHGRARLALRRAVGQDHLHAVGTDGDAHPPRSLGASDPIGDLSHGAISFTV